MQHPIIRFGTAPCGNCGTITTAPLTGEYHLCEGDATCIDVQQGRVCEDGSVRFVIDPAHATCPECSAVLIYVHVWPQDLIESNQYNNVDAWENTLR